MKCSNNFSSMNAWIEALKPLIKNIFLCLIIVGVILFVLYEYDKYKLKDVHSWSEEVCKNHKGVSTAASGKILDKEYYLTMCKDGTSILNEQDKHD